MASSAGQAERGGLQVEEGDLMFGDAFGLGGVLYVELGKFDPPLWHAPYGRIV